MKEKNEVAQQKREVENRVTIMADIIEEKDPEALVKINGKGSDMFAVEETNRPKNTLNRFESNGYPTSNKSNERLNINYGVDLTPTSSKGQIY